MPRNCTWVAGLDATAASGACCPEVAKCKETDAMKIDVRLREELAQKLYEESDRTGVAWVRRPESVKHAFREAAERKLRIHTTATTMIDPGTAWDRTGRPTPVTTRVNQ